MSEIKGFNIEQVEAEYSRLWRENPHKDAYDAISEKIATLRQVQKQFAPKDADVCQIMLNMFRWEENKETLGRMSNQQLCEFAYEKIGAGLGLDCIESDIMDEILRRLGYRYEGKE